MYFKMRATLPVSVIALFAFVSNVYSQDFRPKFDRDYPITAPPLQDVRLDDCVWGPRLQTNLHFTLDYAIENLQRQGSFLLFEVLSEGKKPHPYDREPGMWADSDVYKTIEGGLRMQRINPDARSKEQFLKMVDQLLDRIAKTQAEDGYLMPHIQIFGDRKSKWYNPKPYGKDYQHFSQTLRRTSELYSMGHFLEMAVEHYQLTGSKKAIDIASRIVDCIDANYGPGKREEPSGCPEIEIGLMRLYRATKNPKCFALTKYFDQMHKKVSAHWAGGAPALAHDLGRGHVVAMMYLYCGMVDLAQISGDKELHGLIARKWDNVAQTQVYITGACGHRKLGEGFPPAYNLPNGAYCYCETCSSVSYALWDSRMFCATGNAKYMNLLERTIYNSFPSGVSFRGNAFYYRNHLESEGKHFNRDGTYGNQDETRHAWLGLSCCPTNVVRFIPLIPTYVYAVDDPSGDVYVNLFMQSKAKLHRNGGDVNVRMTSGYPYDGQVKLRYELDRKGGEPPTFRVRIPSWSNQMSWRLDGKTIAPTVEDGYVLISATREQGEIDMQFKMPVRRMVANPNVVDDRGRVALVRGPITYCFEGLDAPGAGIDSKKIVLAEDPEFELEKKEIGPGLEVTAIVCKGTKGEEYTAIPYFARCYRGSTPRSVWVLQAGLNPNPSIYDTSWDGKLYRPLSQFKLGVRK